MTGAGRQVGHYVVYEQLGSGGAGSVYRAVESTSGRAFALKVLRGRPDPSGADQRRFEREVQALSKLNHPNLVRIYDRGLEQGQRYLVMDLIEGESVEERVARTGPLSPAQAAGIVRLVAAAVQHVHEAGLIHRDLKPANVMLAKDGTPFLSDFGLVKHLDPEVSRLTLSGALMGTPGYWAPELASGHPEEATPRSDVYGLGGLLYGALTGAPPLDADSLLELLAATHSRAVDPPSSLNPAVDAVLDEICLRCLEKDPADRYPSAAAVIAELDGYLRGERLAAPDRAAGGGIPAGLYALIGASAAAVIMVLIALLAPSGGSPGASAPPAEPPTPSASPGAETPAVEPPAPPVPPKGVVQRPRSEVAERLFAATTEALREERWVKAIDLACEAIAANDEDAGFHLLHGDALLATGDLWGARRAYSRSIELDPGVMRAYVQRAVCSAQDEKLAEAVADYSAALRFEPDHPVVLRQRASAYLRLGELQRAQSDLERALRVSAEDPLIHHGFGLLNLRLGRRADAVQAFTRALELDPELVETLAERGRVRLALEEAEGLDDLDRALALQPTHARARTLRGTRYLILGRAQEAEADLRVATEDLSRDPDVWERLGMARFRLERWADALRAYDQAVALSPEPSARLLRGRALVEFRKQDYAAALADIDRAIALEPMSKELPYERGRFLLATKDWPGAAAAFNRAIELGHHHHWAYNGRGFASLEQKRYGQALADFELARGLAPREGRIVYNRALALARLGRHAEAVVGYGEALSLDPEFEKSYLRRAESRRALGDDAGALADLSALLAAHPRDLTGLRVRGNLLADLGRVDEAEADLRAYLAISSKGALAEAVRARLATLR